MLRTYDASAFKEWQVNGDNSCLIPLMPAVLFDLNVRSEKELTISLVTEDGQTIPMETGKIVNMKGVNRNYQAIEISATDNFWYQCTVRRTDEEVDPTPVQIELHTSSEDILRNLIDERLRRWKHEQQLNRELTEDEKDELILDLAHGDLEFDDSPDQFGLGYEERLAEFNARQEAAEQSNAEGVPATEPAATPPQPAANPPTVPST